MDFFSQSLHWQEQKESRMRERKLDSLRKADKTLREAPSINASSRKMADSIIEKARRTLKNKYSSNGQRKVYEKSHLKIKNSFKRLNDSLPVNLDVKLCTGQIQVEVSHNQHPPLLPQTDDKSQLEVFKNIKNKMEGKTHENSNLDNAQNSFSIVDLRSKHKERSSCKSQSTYSEKSNKNFEYVAISPSYTQVAYVSGMNMQKFQDKSKPLVDYKLL